MKRTNTGPNIYKTEKAPYPTRIAVFPKQSASQALGHKKPGRHVRVQIELRRASQRKNQYITKMLARKDDHSHELWTPREEIVFTARPKIQSQSQIFRYVQSIFSLPHGPNFSDIFDLCLHWESVHCKYL